MKHYKYLLVILTLFVVTACDVSKLSEEEVNDLGNLNVRVLISDGTHKNSSNSIVVYLTDKNQKKIINKDIKVLLNNTELDLYIKSEIYYQKIAYYHTDKLTEKNSYYFEIMLPDGNRYPLAYIQPLKKYDQTKFHIPKAVSITKDFTLRWDSLNFPTTLEIWKSVLDKNDSRKRSGGRYAESTLLDTISTYNGSFTVPRSFYEDSLTRADFLNVRISSLEHGLTNPKLIQGSEISYMYLVEKTIEINE